MSIVATYDTERGSYFLESWIRTYILRELGSIFAHIVHMKSNGGIHEGGPKGSDLCTFFRALSVSEEGEQKYHQGTRHVLAGLRRVVPVGYGCVDRPADAGKRMMLQCTSNIFTQTGKFVVQYVQQQQQTTYRFCRRFLSYCRTLLSSSFCRRFEHK